jgi:hypothetical protein
VLRDRAETIPRSEGYKLPPPNGITLATRGNRLPPAGDDLPGITEMW